MIIRCIEQFGEDMKECPVFIDIRYADKKRLRSRLEHDQITNLEALGGTFYIFIKDLPCMACRRLERLVSGLAGIKRWFLPETFMGIT